MISLVSEAGIDSFLSFCKDEPLGIRMSAQMLSYGTHLSFASFWLVSDECGVYAAVSKIDGDVTLLCQRQSEELTVFINKLNFITLTCNESLFMPPVFPYKKEIGCVMELKNRNMLCKENCLCFDFEPSVYEFCKLLQKSSGKSIDIGDFQRLYTDLSHRVRHSTARCVIGSKDGENVSTAAVIAETHAGIIIGAVSVLPEARGKGFGRMTVSRLISKLICEGKKICLFRADGENEEFYRLLGFENTMPWATYIRKWDSDGNI